MAENGVGQPGEGGEEMAPGDWSTDIRLLNCLVRKTRLRNGRVEGERVEGIDAESHIMNSILEPGVYTVEGFPNDLMPANLKDQLTPEELEAIVVYLLTLE